MAIKQYIRCIAPSKSTRDGSSNQPPNSFSNGSAIPSPWLGTLLTFQWLFPYTSPSLSLLVLGAVPGGREGTVILSSVFSRRPLSSGRSLFRDHTQSVAELGSESRCPHSSPRPLSASESRMLVSVCLRSAGPVKH